MVRCSVALLTGKESPRGLVDVRVGPPTRTPRDATRTSRNVTLGTVPVLELRGLNTDPRAGQDSKGLDGVASVFRAR
jgi:hypothetical protein